MAGHGNKNPIAIFQIIVYYTFGNRRSHQQPMPRLERRTDMKAKPSESSKESPLTYADYLKGAIIETVSNLHDEMTLRYIHTMLMNAVTAEMQKANC